MQAEEKDGFVFDRSKVNEELTLREAIDLYGKPLPDESNSDYPILCSWHIEDNEFIYIIFETEDRKEFLQSFRNGDYILAEETVCYGDEGVRFMTDNELNTLREWIWNYKATSAYIVKDGQKDIIFDINP